MIVDCPLGLLSIYVNFNFDLLLVAVGVVLLHTGFNLGSPLVDQKKVIFLQDLRYCRSHSLSLGLIQIDVHLFTPFSW